MLYSRHKVRRYLSGRIVWENNFTQHKNTSKKTDISFVYLCIVIATQDNLPTRKIISAGAQTITDSKRHSIPCNNQKKVHFAFKVVWKFMTFVYRKTFSSRKRYAQYVGNSKKTKLKNYETPSKA